MPKASPTSASARPRLPLACIHLFTLAAVAVAQPVFEILARHGQVFVARGFGRWELLGFVAAVLLGPAAVLCGTVFVAKLITVRLGQTIHLGSVAFLVTIAALPILEIVVPAPGIMLIAIAAAVGGLFAVAYHRLGPVRFFVTALTPALIVVPAVFMSHASVRAIVAPTPAPDTVIVKHPAPVIFIVLDEMHAASIMDSEGLIDGRRFPGFDRLARSSTWFRNATTVADDTAYAVPAILTGSFPKPDTLPLTRSYPGNLFTLLGQSHEVVAFEVWTRLCPQAIARRSSGIDRSPWTLMVDVSIIFLHTITPEDVAQVVGLPALDARWVGFAQAWRPDDSTAEAPDLAASSYEDPRSQFASFVSSLSSTEKPGLYYLHLNLPHVPWQYLPSGQKYGPLDRWFLPHGVLRDVWGSDRWETVQGYQRYLLQVGYVDKLIAELMDRLHDLKLFDECLLIVVADHGTSFVPGAPRREAHPSNLGEMASVPLLIKAPGQSVGTINDDLVSTIDIMPTLAEALGIDLPWHADGRSLLGRAASNRETPRVLLSQDCRQQFRIDGDQHPWEEVLQRQISVFGEHSPLDEIFKIGPHRELIGRHVGDISASNRHYRVEIEWPDLYDDVDPASGFVPARIKAAIQSEGAEPLALAVAVNHTIRATTWSFMEAGARKFSAMVPPGSFTRGENRIEVFVITSTGQGGVALETTSQELPPRFSLAAPPMQGLADSDGREFADREGAVGGFVERVDWSYGGLSVSGWAVDQLHRRPADWIAVFAEDEPLFVGRTTSERPDIVGMMRTEDVRWSGFDFRMPGRSSQAIDLSTVRIFAVSEPGLARELPLYVPD